ncbi:hypothetical protein HpBTM60_01980 [Helicobacter pylori]
MNGKQNTTVTMEIPFVTVVFYYDKYEFQTLISRNFALIFTGKFLSLSDNNIQKPINNFIFKHVDWLFAFLLLLATYL